MLLTNFASTTLALMLPLSVSALSVVRPEALVLNNQYPTAFNGEKWSWENCGLPDDILQINSIEVSPDPPQPGKDLTVTVTGSALGKIEEGAYADVTVKLGLIKLLQKRFDVCEEARNANATVQCPVSTGDYKVTQTVALPKEIPPAKFIVNVRGYTAEDDDMLCLNLKVDFMKQPFLN